MEKIYEIYMRNIKYILIAISTTLFLVMAYLYFKGM